MLKKILNIFLLSNGISALDEKQPEDKWEKFRREREEWEREHGVDKTGRPKIHDAIDANARTNPDTPPTNHPE